MVSSTIEKQLVISGILDWLDVFDELDDYADGVLFRPPAVPGLPEVMQENLGTPTGRAIAGLFLMRFEFTYVQLQRFGRHLKRTSSQEVPKQMAVDMAAFCVDRMKAGLNHHLN